MIENKKGHIYTGNWSRNLILSMIKKDFDNWTIKELPVKKNKKKEINTFRYIFTKEKKSNEFIE